MVAWEWMPMDCCLDMFLDLGGSRVTLDVVKLEEQVT